MANRTIDFSQEEQESVRSEIRNKVQEIQTALRTSEIRETRDEFLEKFILCELTYKIVLKKYLEVNAMYDPKKMLTIQIQQVRTALLRAGYTPDEGLLDRLFSGTGDYKKRGHKSAKMLRNGIEHEMNVPDMKEVMERRESLMKDMDDFLVWIQN